MSFFPSLFLSERISQYKVLFALLSPASRTDVIRGASRTHDRPTKNICGSVRFLMLTWPIVFQVLESLSGHDLKYLDISDCKNVTSVQVSKLLAQQPNIEELSLQGTFTFPASPQVFDTLNQLRPKSLR